MNLLYNITKSCRRYKYFGPGSFMLILQIMVVTSCKKLVEIDAPVTSLTAKNVYTDDATAAAVLTAIYASMGSGDANYTGLNGISLRTGLSSDELTLWSGGFGGTDLQRVYQNNLLAVGYWREYYKKLLTINSAIEGLETSNHLTSALKTQLLGEARFMRAFFHFYLVNMYGEIPIATTSDWRINAVAHRMPKADVYQQIVADLKVAQNLLSDKYLQSDGLTVYSIANEERVRPTKWAATALLARTYLYMKEWAHAEEQASLVINNVQYSLNTLERAFEKNNSEAIWQIQYVITSEGTDGFHFILTEDPSNARPTYLSSFLMRAFESGDNRKVKWVDSFSNGSNTWYFPYKYKAAVVSIQDPVTKVYPSPSEYFMVMRLAEQYLIRAEAKAQLNNVSGAQSDLNTIRTRAGLPNTIASTPASLLTAILHERQVELFTEWGQRWFDLKRTGTIDTVMKIVLPTKRPGFTWNTNWQLYPLSASDIQLNPNLAPNNPGY